MSEQASIVSARAREPAVNLPAPEIKRNRALRPLLIALLSCGAESGTTGRPGLGPFSLKPGNIPRTVLVAFQKRRQRQGAEGPVPRAVAGGNKSLFRLPAARQVATLLQERLDPWSTHPRKKHLSRKGRPQLARQRPPRAAIILLMGRVADH
ncbi:hypothetical protein MRX96_005257 [Rhipicephalus microplus]